MEKARYIQLFPNKDYKTNHKEIIQLSHEAKPKRKSKPGKLKSIVIEILKFL